MYPSSVKRIRSDRVQVEPSFGGFYAGTTFRAFKEITLAANASLNIKMTRGVDLVLRKFAMHVKEGEMRCEVYRGATPSGTWNDAISIIPCCEFSDLPASYATQCTLTSGGSYTGGTLYDLMHVRTAGASGQSSTVADEATDALGIPKDSVGMYHFTNPGNSSSTCIFTMLWEELPIK